VADYNLVILEEGGLYPVVIEKFPGELKFWMEEVKKLVSIPIPVIGQIAAGENLSPSLLLKVGIR